MNRDRVQEIVRRVVGRVLSGQSPSNRAPGAGSSADRPGGVHVEVEPGGQRLRPHQLRPGGVPARDTSGTLLVTAEDLAGIADGGTLEVAPGARLTPLAREDAWRRGIQLGHGFGAGGGAGALRIAVGADHGGYSRKEGVKRWLRELGHQPIDFGTHDENAVDYPDFAQAVAEAVAAGRADLGVCVDGAGIGSAMAANKVPGARAALCYDEATARNAREHNFANVLTLGAKMTEGQCERILRTFLSTPEGAARHERRVAKIAAIESRYTGQQHPLRRVLPAVPGKG